jgi:hypothetical protein
MARIFTYASDTDLSKSDKLLGSDSGGSTRNYTLGDLSKYLGASGISGQCGYQFVNSNFNGNSSQQNGQMSIAGLSGATKSFSQISSVILSEFCFDKSTSSLQRVNHFNGQEIIISQVDDPNNFAVYKVNNVTPVSGTTLHTLDLQFKSGNGNISNLENYSIRAMPDSDKHVELQFANSNFVRVNGALQFETINGSNMCYIDFEHNLGKKPAISAEQEGSPGQVAMMPVKYINNNKVRIYFTGTTSGKIFAN